MNIYLVGNNNAGKTTISKELYKLNYNLLKYSPLDKINYEYWKFFVENDTNTVFDRWRAIDLLFYRKDSHLLDYVCNLYRIFNQYNMIIYLVNEQRYVNNYDYDKVIQRPNYNTHKELDIFYENVYQLLKKNKVNIIKIKVDKHIKNTMNKIKESIKLYEKKVL